MLEIKNRNNKTKTKTNKKKLLNKLNNYIILNYLTWKVL